MMIHRAFVFDHAAYEAELYPTLAFSYASRDPQYLKRFVDAHRAHLVEPTSGAPALADRLLRGHPLRPDATSALEVFVRSAAQARLDLAVTQELARAALAPVEAMLAAAVAADRGLVVDFGFGLTRP